MSADPKSAADQAYVAVAGRVALVKVEGRGSFKISASLKQFGDSVVKDRLPLLLLDMSLCIGMDSTFMGVLAGIASKLKTQAGRVVLVNCTPRTRGLLATLGLDQLISAYEAGQTPEDYENILHAKRPSDQLDAASCRDEQTMRTMLDAHQNLVDLVPENMPQFRDVLVYLREELNKKTGEEQGAR
ncbi:MAG TPA: STAS domain-containing protein [Kiritimatiellia bacterium]|nr:STAS domain-containing protein [Kiritimatiellia bacterium]